MPQGGVDIGEDYLTAMKRELFEETSIISIQVLKEIEGYFEYQLPKIFLGIIWKVSLEVKSKNGLLQNLLVMKRN